MHLLVFMLAILWPAIAIASDPVPQVDLGAITADLASHNWQALAAILLPLFAWALRRFQGDMDHKIHGVAAGRLVPLGLAIIGAFAPVLDSHSLTIQSAISALSVGITSWLAMSNPTTAAVAAAPPIANKVD